MILLTLCLPLLVRNGTYLLYAQTLKFVITYLVASPPRHSSHSHAGVIAGAAIGGAVGLAVIAGAVLILYRRFRMPKTGKSPAQTSSSNDVLSISPTPASWPSPQQSTVVPPHVSSETPSIQLLTLVAGSSIP